MDAGCSPRSPWDCGGHHCSLPAHFCPLPSSAPGSSAPTRRAPTKGTTQDRWPGVTEKGYSPALPSRTPAPRSSSPCTEQRTDCSSQIGGWGHGATAAAGGVHPTLSTTALTCCGSACSSPSGNLCQIAGDSHHNCQRQASFEAEVLSKHFTPSPSQAVREKRAVEGNPIPCNVSLLWQHFGFTARRAVVSVRHRGSLKEQTALGLNQKSPQAKKIFFFFF